MKAFITLAIFGLILSACKSSPVLNPVQSAVCDVESTITSATGSLIVSQCAGTDAVSCGNAIQTALGNANLCALPLPTGVVTGLTATPKLTVGSITQAQIDAAKKSMGLKTLAPMGVVGNMVCPLAETDVLGFLTAEIPVACGCTKNIDAGGIGALLVSACEVAIPL
jgi:hypothetical protein